MAPTETLEIEMSPRDSHTRTPVPCDVQSCPEVDRVNELWAAVMGKDGEVGIKGTVDRHERIFVFLGKVGTGIGVVCIGSAVIFAVSTLAFVSTANKLRAEMHQDSVQQTQIK